MRMPISLFELSLNSGSKKYVLAQGIQDAVSMHIEVSDEQVMNVARLEVGYTINAITDILDKNSVGVDDSWNDALKVAETHLKEECRDKNPFSLNNGDIKRVLEGLRN